MPKIDKILDLRNKKILFELEQNSRQSLQKIARKVRLSKEAVFNRIKNLEKSDIIKKYLTEINVYKIGYQFYPILLKFQSTTPEIENNIISYLRNNKYVAWLTICEGNWDVNLTVLAKDNYDFNIFLNNFLNKYSKYVSEKLIFITTEIHYFKRGFWLNKATEQTISTGGIKALEIKDKDLQLLKILSENARMPLIEIAKRLNINAKNISYKIKKLEKEDIIQGSRILVDFAKIGYKFYKIWFSLKNIDKENEKKIYNYFKSNPNIIWATKLIGYYDLSIEMEVKDVNEFRIIVNEIKQKFSNLIKKHESLLIFEEYVMNYLPKD